MVTFGVEVLKTAVTLCAGAHPKFWTVTFKALHSFVSMIAFPLPPEIVTAEGSVGSTIGLAMPERHVLKVVVPPSVMVTIEVEDGVQLRLPFDTVTV